MQHLGLTIYQEKYSNKWLKEVEHFIAELRINQPDDLLNLEILTNAYERTVKPLISLATTQGFSPNWVYR